MEIDFSKPHSPQLPTKILRRGPIDFQALAFSHDGKYLAGTYSSTIWETESGKEVSVFDNECAERPLFSPQSNYFATAGESNGTVEIFRHSWGHLERRFLGQLDEEHAWKLLFSQDETRLHVLTECCLYTWNLKEERLVAKHRMPPGVDAMTMFESDRGMIVYCHSGFGNQELRVRVFEVETGVERANALIEGKVVDGPVVSDDGEYVDAPIAMRPGYHVVLTVKNNSLAAIEEEHILALGHTRAISDGLLIVGLRSINVWDLRTCQLMNTLELRTNHDPWGQSLTYSSAAKLLAVTIYPFETDDLRTLFIEPRTGNIRGATSGHVDESRCFSPDGRWFASAIDYNYQVSRTNCRIEPGTVYLTDLRSIVPSSCDRTTSAR